MLPLPAPALLGRRVITNGRPHMSGLLVTADSGHAFKYAFLLPPFIATSNTHSQRLKIHQLLQTKKIPHPFGHGTGFRILRVFECLVGHYSIHSSVVSRSPRSVRKRSASGDMPDRSFSRRLAASWSGSACLLRISRGVKPNLALNTLWK